MVKRTLIWAVDPFREKFKHQNAALRALNMLADDETRIQPVYVSHAHDEAEVISQRERADAILHQWTFKRLLGELEPIEVLHSPSSNLSEQALAVATYARKRDAFFIVACHLPRFALRKWFAGSFCESLSVIADASVLVVTEKWRLGKSRKPARILFATDFSAHSLCAFQKVLDFAEDRKWAITVFHNVEYPLYPEMEFVYSASDVLDRIEGDLISSAREKARALGDAVRKRGLAVKVVVDESHRNHAGLAVMREISSGYHLIAVAAHSGLIQRTFVGSTSRYLIRESSTPVWIIRIPEEQIATAVARMPAVTNETDITLDF